MTRGISPLTPLAFHPEGWGETAGESVSCKGKRPTHRCVETDPDFISFPQREVQP